jgi:hypothetical protein
MGLSVRFATQSPQRAVQKPVPRHWRILPILLKGARVGGARARLMSDENPAEERCLQYLARADEARLRANETEDAAIRDWWVSAAEAWEYLARRPDYGKSGR